MVCIIIIDQATFGFRYYAKCAIGYLIYKGLALSRWRCVDLDHVELTLVYLTYSDRLIDGSPKNSVTAVPVERNNPIPLAK